MIGIAELAEAMNALNAEYGEHIDRDETSMAECVDQMQKLLNVNGDEVSAFASDRANTLLFLLFGGPEGIVKGWPSNPGVFADNPVIGPILGAMAGLWIEGFSVGMKTRHQNPDE